MANSKVEITISDDVEKFWDDTSEQTLRMDEYEYDVSKLIDLSKDFSVLDIPLSHLCTYRSIGNMDVSDFASHMRQVIESDLKHPIILSPDGRIMDGSHRLVKAILTGRKAIKAVRFKKWPQYLRKEEDGD